ncbi:carboxylesterase family protein [Deminuibacter soli]|uniref:carboxylesterase family protein n=1 Tax=Deminuibacter soli TaxID=2291815 RepID=UPI001B8691CC|nr:carboxylesterase family protein [Deminuibacter soli]
MVACRHTCYRQTARDGMDTWRWFCIWQRGVSWLHPDGNTELPKLLTMVNTDKVWAEPARFTARAFVAKGAPAYVYQFGYVAASMQQFMRYGAAHASEIAYVFDNLRSPNGALMTPEDQAVAKVMNAYWTNFAKTGNPNGSGLPDWPAFDPAKNGLMVFQPDGKAVGQTDPKKARLDAMEKAAAAAPHSPQP